MGVMSRILLSSMARWCGSRAAESFEGTKIAADQSLLFRPGPALELTFPLHGLNRRNRPLTIHQAWLTMVMGVLTAQPEAMFADALMHVTSLADVERTVGGLQDIYPSEIGHTLRAWDCGKYF